MDSPLNVEQTLSPCVYGWVFKALTVVLVTVWLKMEMALLESWYRLAGGHKFLCMEKSRSILYSAQLTLQAVVWRG